MNPLSEILRTARERQGLSIDDLATATRIQKKFLKALEEGNFTILPQTYVRAFLRSYAKEVRLNPSDIMREYDLLDSGSTTGLRSDHNSSPTASVDAAKELRESAGRSAQRTVLIVASAILVAGLVATLYLFREPTRKLDVTEIPFQDVVRQHQRIQDTPQRAVHDSALVNKDTSHSISGSIAAAPDTGGRVILPQIEPQAVAPRDSLLLRILALDSVVIRVVMDGRRPREYRVPARWSGRWKAAEYFLVSLSNPSAAAITLNNVAIRPPAEPGKPVANMRLSAASLPRRASQAKPKP